MTYRALRWMPRISILAATLVVAFSLFPGMAGNAASGAPPATPSGAGPGCDAASGGAPGPMSHGTPSFDTVLSIDSSGSMMTNDPTWCRLVAARDYINSSWPGDRIAVLDFDSSCKWTGPDHNLDSAGHDGNPDFSDPWTDVGQIDSSGATNLLCAIQDATAELVGRGDPAHVWVEILLTDGEDTMGNNAPQLYQAAMDAAAEGITIFTIGFGQANAIILEQIAYLTGGQFFWATDCATIIEAYHEISAALASSGNTDPAAATPLTAYLSGPDVVISWVPSPDDGAGVNDVARYEIWYGTAYDGTGASYTRLGSVPRGNTEFSHLGAAGPVGVDYFYEVRVVDYTGHSAASPDQFARLETALSPGRHLVSPGLSSQDLDATTLFQTIPWTRISAYRDGGWVTAYQGRSHYGTLWIEPAEGVWVDTAAGSWIRAGLVLTSLQVTLHRGWNLFGYPLLESRPIGVVLGGLPYVSVEGYAPEGPYHLKALSAADSFTFGQGYWVQMRQDAVLTLTL